MKTSEKEGFKSPTKTAKQPRKEKFALPIFNPFEALNKEADGNQDPPPTKEKEKEIIPPKKHNLSRSLHNPEKETQENQEENSQEKSNKRSNPNEENQEPENFSFLDAVKENQNFFRSFSQLLEACKKMKNTENNTDKFNIFIQGIASSLP
ncbi:hypothetical protein NPIL_413131 [Nephila pilipes]|uniref:Uncharacterized protein n=1 Tax=Nephila pilipes TaxID=299642 RepID=A0A8X6THU6_NEPPI|nr:hypothetical protein NPIL_413131 [Nephila pilipes]